MVTEKNCIAPWSLDLIITPLVAFDSRGHRLGMGGGFYDRTFAFKQDCQRTNPKLVGLAYDFQQISTLTCQPWDISLDCVVTETRLILCNDRYR